MRDAGVGSSGADAVGAGIAAWIGRSAGVSTLPTPLQVARVGPDPQTVVLYGVVAAVVGLVLGAGIGVFRARRAGADPGTAPKTRTKAQSETRTKTQAGTRTETDAVSASTPVTPAPTAGDAPSPDGRSTPGGATGQPSRIPRAPEVAVTHADLTDEEPIGGGGNADVTKATLSTPGGDVSLAVKRPRLSGTLHADAVERLLGEAETWDKLDDHDHVVGVVGYGAEPLPWIAMEYMDAGDLSERSGRLSTPQALWTALAVTKGVRHAHRRGVAHLDLKPENVLFRSVDGAWDVPKVADWGLSKHLLDHSQSVEGLSPHYAAPEQFDADYGPADDRTDIYQLGTVLYDLFTGRPPFEGDSTRVMRAILDDRPAPPSAVADVPEALDDVLLTALATEKEDRYDDIVYLRDDLQELYDAR
ncbi:serine/threonine-protein kinase [Haloplanus pelagicus]|uniref:serine/threonine-protein kinase n=1 Tax=Haloplanus pelagicus TaxID=2949995 RepID=UPI00203A5C02|nr:serine/threonine-protein kinase [Haloplanus sp. HW8-1]